MYDGRNISPPKMTDTFKTIQAPTLGEYKEKGSKFIAHAHPIQTEEQFQRILQQIKKEHPKASHHCFAYRIQVERILKSAHEEIFRSTDDGEPSGTAGGPIITQINAQNLTNTAIIVVRYFGGTLLGVPGLIKAYKESAAASLQNAQIIEQILQNHYQIQFNYEIMPNIMNALKKLNIQPTNQQFDTHGQIQFSIRQSESETQISHLKAQILNISSQHATQIHDHPSFQISQI